MARGRSRSFEWGRARRPIVKNTVGAPNPKEGSDGDIQIRNTSIGAKMFGKLGGRWYDTPLSIDGTMRIGTNLSNHLSIDSDSVDIITNGTKVASFGATTTVKDINLTGKIVLTSSGTRNVCIGVDNADVSGAEDNISIGSKAGEDIESGGLRNICIGTDAGKDITTGDNNVIIGSTAATIATATDNNVMIGRGAGEAYTSGVGSNVCVGTYAGTVLEDGFANFYIGHLARASGASVQGEGVLACGNVGGVVGNGSNTITLGSFTVKDIYMASDSGATVHCGAVVHGLSSVLVTSSTLAYGTHSVSKLKYVTVTADAQTLVLPAVQIGAVFIIVNMAANGAALLTIDPNGNDKFLTDIAGGVGTDGNNISNTKATQKQGDFVKLVGMHADGWAITEIGGIWADE